MRRPAAATWVPLVGLLVVVALSLYVTAEAPDRPGAQLLAAVQAFCGAVSDGELDAALAHLAPRSRSARNADRIAHVVAQRRGASWLVVRVDPQQGTTAVVWDGAISDRERPEEVLHWVSQPDGAWRLVL